VLGAKVDVPAAGPAPLLIRPQRWIVEHTSPLCDLSTSAILGAIGSRFFSVGVFYLKGSAVVINPPVELPLFWNNNLIPPKL